MLLNISGALLVSCVLAGVSFQIIDWLHQPIRKVTHHSTLPFKFINFSYMNSRIQNYNTRNAQSSRPPLFLLGEILTRVVLYFSQSLNKTAQANLISLICQGLFGILLKKKKHSTLH